MQLNLGCGDWKIPAPWVNVDGYSGARPDVVADIKDLQFADHSADMIYCGHVLEHLIVQDVLLALREIKRVLRPAGRLCVVGPDETRALANPEWHPLLPGIREGGDRWPGDKHQWVATGTNSLWLVRCVFPEAIEVELADVPEEWPVWDRNAGWQFAVLAR